VPARRRPPTSAVSESSSEPAPAPAPQLVPPSPNPEAGGSWTVPQPEQNLPVLDPREGRRSVLVAVINNEADLQRATTEGWYRIPQRTAPRRIGADYLALYLTSGATGKGNEGAHCVAWYAAIRRYRLTTRRDLIPAEPDHPRASDAYFRIDIGPLQRLANPVPAASYRRLTFIHTTLERLMTARDVTELFCKDDPFDLLWDALRKHKLRPLKNRIVNEAAIDISLRARKGMLGISCRDELAAQEARIALSEDRWQLLTLPNHHIQQDLEGCLRRIGSALLGLGGSVLNG